MVAVKGLSTFKRRVSGERVIWKSGGFKSLKVYSEDAVVKINGRDNVVAETKRKSVPVNAENSLNKLEKINGKNINFAQTNVRRKVLGDISNSQVTFGKNGAVDGFKPGKGKLERMTHVQRASVSSSKDLKVFNGNSKTRGQETFGYVTRKSLTVLKHVDKGEKSDIKKGNKDSNLKNKEKVGFPVKPKVGMSVVPRTSNINANCEKIIKDACNKLDKIDGKNINRAQTEVGRKSSVDIRNSKGIFQKNEAVDGFKTGNSKTGRMAYSQRASVSSTKVLKVFDGNSKTKGQETFGHVTRKSLRVLKHVDNGETSNISKGNEDNKSKKNDSKQRVSRIAVKPTIRTSVGIPKAQRVSRTTSVFTKKIEEPSSSESIACQQIAQGVTLDASITKLTAKVKSGRRKSYTTLLIEKTKILNEEARGTKEEILPNIYDDGNQLEVAEYVDEIYQHYWVAEANNRPLKNYMEIQTDITPQMRAIHINWLIEVHLKFHLMQETLYLMVTVLDSFLSAVTIKKNEMQLVGVTSLLLASKYEDFWHPLVKELISISVEVYTREQVLAMETMILETLSYRLNMPTPYVFMLRFLKAAQGDKKFEKLAFFLIELCLVENDALQYKPSLLCASAIYVARCTLHLTPAWTPLLCKHSRYQEFQIRDCAEMILGFHQATTRSVLRVTYDKYKSSKNCEVALIKPLVGLPPL